MKSYRLPLILFLLVTSCLIFSPGSSADPSPSPSPSQSFSVSVPAQAASSVSVAAPAAPPQWAQELILDAQALPVVGPIVSKALLYAGIIGSILTMLAACLSSILTMLSGVLNYTGLTNAVNAIAAFQNGKIMYWIKFFSFFNAKKPDPAGTVSSS